MKSVCDTYDELALASSWEHLTDEKTTKGQVPSSYNFAVF